MLNSILRYISGVPDEQDEEDGSYSVAGPSGAVDSGSSSSLTQLSPDSPIVFSSYQQKSMDYNARSSLPAQMLQRDQISVWSILKQSIGKELSKITMPVVFNEPLSFLQRLTEYMEYSDILSVASEAADPVKRMEFVAAFAVSALASNWERVAKPFNPLLGETYELDRLEDLGFRIVCEQVSHHPPVSAFHADSDLFRFYGSIYPKLKFWGRSVEIQPRGIITLELLKHNEIYTWTNVNCSVHNLVMGKMYIEQHGIMEIINHSNNLKCTLNFKPSSSWFGREINNHIEGFITDKNKQKLRALYGAWTEFLASCPTEVFERHFASLSRDQKRSSVSPRSSISNSGSPPHESNNRTPKTAPSFPVLNGSDVLWRVKPRPADSSLYYHFTSFAMILNELDEGDEKKLPPTDCRLRPDMRVMEEGDWDKAAAEKHRLEEKQRAARSQRRKEKTEWECNWFQPGRHGLVRDDTWHFQNSYWNRNFSRCPDIF